MCTFCLLQFIGTEVHSCTVALLLKSLKVNKIQHQYKITGL